MKLLITNAVVFDPQSAYHRKKVDILISNGLIESIQLSSTKNNSNSSKVLDAKGASISPGFVDMRAALREPGYEFKEDLISAANAASAGGYTSVCALPNTLPITQNKSDIEFIKQRGLELPVHLLPYGAVTKNTEGQEMNELYDMKQAGAVAFTDGNKCLMHAGVMMRAMLYSKIFGGLILSHAEDTNLSAGGRIHEGKVSVNLGLKGIPNMAEEIIIARDIEVARYTQAALHFSHISSKGSVELIKKAKKQGLPITCDVAVANLIYTDEALTEFDSNYKLTPPLRSKTDQKALWDALADGTIDCIVTDHTPEDVEHKILEFEYAAKGMIMLQTAFSLLHKYKPATIENETIINALTTNPRKILNQPSIKIEAGSKAELCLYDEKKDWIYSTENNYSKSINSPALNQTLPVKIIATINKDKLYKHN